MIVLQFNSMPYVSILVSYIFVSSWEIKAVKFCRVDVRLEQWCMLKMKHWSYWMKCFGLSLKTMFGSAAKAFVLAV